MVGRPPSRSLAVRWFVLFGLANALLAVAGPALVGHLPKQRSPHTFRGFGDQFSYNFDSIFLSHALSRPPAPGEQRLVVVGNSVLAQPAFRAELQAALAARARDDEVYSVAWPGLTVSGQAAFAVRAASCSPALVLWAISPIDCRVSRPLVPCASPVLGVSYAPRLGTAVHNLRRITLENCRDLWLNLLGAALPYARYRGVLSEWAPPRPVLPRSRSAAVAPATQARPPGVVRYPARLYSPDTAAAALSEALPSLRSAGSELVVVVMPHCHVDAYYGPGAYDRFVNALRTWTEAHDVAFVDLSGVAPTSAFVDHVHLAPSAYRSVCGALADRLPATTGVSP